MENLRIDGQRLWDSLMEMAQIGATEKGGVCRLALTDLDRQARDLFVRLVRGRRAARSRSIAMGNIFARRPGAIPTLPPVMTGSHLDSQPTGGKFDGAYGVLAGLEVMRTLNDVRIETEAPVEVVVWTNEEGSRFAPAMMGSGVYAGVFDLDYVCRAADADGKTFGAELHAHRLCRARPRGEPSGRRLFRGAYRAGADPGGREEDHRRRHRRPGPALVRDHADRPGGACRADADGAAARRAGRRRAHGRARSTASAWRTSPTPAPPSA